MRFRDITVTAGAPVQVYYGDMLGDKNIRTECIHSVASTL